MSSQALIEELANDPLGRGYAGMTREQLDISLNTLNRTRPRATMNASEVLNAVNVGEYTALTNANKDKLWQLLAIGDLNPFGVEAQLMQSIFGVSATITALQALRQETVSRATELGIVVNAGILQGAGR